jgi:hydrogenase maturation protease
VLILGCGNLDRSDDGAGLLVARRLRQLGVDVREHSGETLALIEAWSGCAEVVVVDAIVSGAPPGAITVWDAQAAPLAVRRFRSSTHAFGVADTVELARVLDRLPPRLIVYAIEGIRFDHGGAPSLEVSEAIERLAQELAREAIQDSGVRAAQRPVRPFARPS